jgi:hypothetical protein
MKKSILKSMLAFSLLLSLHTTAQDLQLPKLPETKEEFINSEKDFITAEKWLETTPVGTNMDYRKLADAWVIAWLINSPTVTVGVRASIMKAFDKNKQLTGLFMAGYGRYCLENNYSKEELKGATAGLKAVFNCYLLGGDIKKDKGLEKLIEQDKDGKLEDWVKEAMAKK